MASHYPTIIAECPACGHSVAAPNWNPYEGQWECPACDAADIDLMIPASPLTADFPFYNLDPEL